MRLTEVATHLAGIAIQRARRARELALHREHLEELVAARTAELTAAVARADQINGELSSALETLSLAQDELVRRDKLAALGALVAGVSHELNTPIGNSLVVATSFADRTRTLNDALASGLRRSELDRYLADAGEAGELLVRNLKRAATLVAGFKQIAVDQISSERRRHRARGPGPRLRPVLHDPDGRGPLGAGLARGAQHRQQYPRRTHRVAQRPWRGRQFHAAAAGHGAGAARVRAAAARGLTWRANRLCSGYENITGNWYWPCAGRAVRHPGRGTGAMVQVAQQARRQIGLLPDAARARLGKGPRSLSR
jgi:hypothetical protein